MQHTTRNPFLLCAMVTALMLSAVWTKSSEAQVLRCIDPSNGQVSYTDGQCQKGHAPTEIVPQRSSEEIARDEELARIARERWNAEQKAAPPLTSSPPTSAVPSESDPRKQACESARNTLSRLTSNPDTSIAAIDAAQRNMEMQCLGPDAYAALERSRANALAPNESTVILPAPPHRPPHHAGQRPPREPEQKLNCNVFRCQDQYGRTTPAPRPGG